MSEQKTDGEVARAVADLLGQSRAAQETIDVAYAAFLYQPSVSNREHLEDACKQYADVKRRLAGARATPVDYGDNHPEWHDDDLR